MKKAFRRKSHVGCSDPGRLHAGKIDRLLMAAFQALLQRFNRLVIGLTGCVALIACVYGCTPSAHVGDGVAEASSIPTIHRSNFLGAFFRAEGTVPYGVMSVYSPQRAPEPYPTPGSRLFGRSGYCDVVEDNGVSITTGYVVDQAKLANIVDLGVRWTRTGVSPFNDDASHIFNRYQFTDFDSAQCALARHHIVPTIAISAGPVIYNAVEGQYSPKSVPIYKTPADFATWCGVVVRHEMRVFPAVSRYTLPGNEVNSSPENFPGGESQIAQYAEACYHAIKSLQPKAYVYGFEINMDARRQPVDFVQRMYDLGCKPGTCYDGLSIHLSLRYPIPPPSAPCSEGSMGCISEMQAAAHAPVHFLIGETVYVVPASVANETVKAAAIVAAMKTFAANKFVDGVNYANVDECDLYPSGYFVGGCIVNSLGKRLPGYAALRALAISAYQ